MKIANEWQKELSGETSIESIKSIQADAWRQGMLDAADIVNQCRGEESDLRCVRDRIIIEAAHKTP